jgi:hypothetical protein
MISSATLGSLRFPSVLPGTSLSRWLALVYPACARTLSQPWSAAVPSAPLAVLHRPSGSFVPLSSVLVHFATIGSAPQTC